MVRKIRNAARGVLALTFVLFVVLSVSYALADESTEVPAGPAPSIEATEVERGEGFFREADDEPAMRPNHPPLDQIPPMPMPEETDEPPVSTGPGEGVYYNSLTGEEIVVPVDDLSMLEEFVQGGGYSGVDGAVGGGPANMIGDMSHITNTQNSPWRMNAKVVMRFEDTGGGSHYATCSGSMRDAETVLTAGHCVYDYGGYGWAKEIWVYPGWDGVGGQFNPPPSIINHYGYGHGTYLGSWTGWTNSGDFNYDVGLIGVTRAVGVLTGWFGWAYGGSCNDHLALTYHNASFPAESCGGGLHNGSDMYYWYGNFNSCPSWNRLELTTTGGCFNAIWGGMSGSGAYYIDSGNRYVHGITSTSNRSTYGRYARQWQDWVNWSNGTFLPNVRGSDFDVQALDVNAEPANIQAGDSTTLLNHLATNPTNGSADGTWVFRVYLSTNDNISISDTLLSTQNYSWNFNPMSSVRINMVQVTIPINTPEGDYWIGVIYDPLTDGNSANNDTDGWDPVPIHVTAAPADPVADIKANGSDGPITIAQGANLIVNVELDPGDRVGDNADWWVLADAGGTWYSYTLSGAWKLGFWTTYQGPLAALSPYEVLNYNGLSSGTYVFYFGVDMIMNGTIDFSDLYYDSVEVNITP